MTNQVLMCLNEEELLETHEDSPLVPVPTRYHERNKSATTKTQTLIFTKIISFETCYAQQ